MLAECARMLWRRRLWVILSIIVSLVAGVAVYEKVKPQQESVAQVLFVGSVKDPGVTGPTNPFMNLGGSLGVVANIVSVGVTDDRTTQALYYQGSTGTYKVVPNLTENAGPTLIVTVDSVSKATTERTLTAVVGQIRLQLRQIQLDRDVNPDLFITAQVITSSVEPVLVNKVRIQQSAITVGGILLLLLVLILLIERTIVRRRARRAAAAPTESVVAEPVVDEPAAPVPVAQSPVTPVSAVSPVREVSVREPVATRLPVAKPATDPAPAVEAPVEAPVGAEESAVEEPAVVADDSAVEEPAVVADESAADESAVEEPAVEPAEAEPTRRGPRLRRRTRMSNGSANGAVEESAESADSAEAALASRDSVR